MYDSQTIEHELCKELVSITGLVSACETLLENGFTDIVAGMRDRLIIEVCQSSRVLHGYCGDPMLMSKTSARRWHDQFSRIWNRARTVAEKLPATEVAHQPELAIVG